MRLALEQARRADLAGEVPVGAVLVDAAQQVVACAHNQPIQDHDPTAHAEIVVLRAAAAAASNYRLPDLTLYVTIEPCLMCVGALVQARVGTIVYGASEPRWGALRSILELESLALNHRFAVRSGILEAECRALLVDFFRARRLRS